MYRINKVCIDLLLLLILSVSSLSAQVATTTSEGYPVIDLSAWEPLGAVLSSEEAASRHMDMKKQTPSQTAFLKPAGSTVSSENGTWNAKMSIKYQVMRANLGTTSDWISAWKACKEYDKEGGAAGTWRLPTQRELQMIWVLHPQLIGQGSFTAFGRYTYWSATEYAADRTWSVYFAGALMNGTRKNNDYRVRCVRDL